MDAIFSLPMVLLHRDFGTYNLTVDEKSCRLLGIVDWVEAEIWPFGLNIHCPESFMESLHVRGGWVRYEDHDTLECEFWHTF